MSVLIEKGTQLLQEGTSVGLRLEHAPQLTRRVTGKCIGKGRIGPNLRRQAFERAVGLECAGFDARQQRIEPIGAAEDAEGEAQTAEGEHRAREVPHANFAEHVWDRERLAHGAQQVRPRQCLQVARLEGPRARLRFDEERVGPPSPRVVATRLTHQSYWCKED